MARKQQAATGGKQPKPAPSIVMAPASVVRQARTARMDDGLARTAKQRAALPGYGRDNPAALAGEALRLFANERGLARSEVDNMPDEKVREQLRYQVSAAYGEG